jgi:homogentisate 1,2-dioxygenase
MTEGATPQWIRGTTSRQAHADLPPGTVEEEHGREGFTGRASHLYRLNAPTGWQSLTGPLRPHALDTSVVPTETDGLAVSILENTDVRIAVWHLRPSGPEWFLRDADGDICYFVHAGTGTLGT